MLRAERQRETDKPQDLEDAISRFEKVIAHYKIHLRPRQSPCICALGTGQAGAREAEYHFISHTFTEILLCAMHC